MPRHVEEETVFRKDLPDDRRRHAAIRRLGAFVPGMRVRYLVDVGIEVDGMVVETSPDGEAHRVVFDVPLDWDGRRWTSRWATPLWLRGPA